MPKKLSAEQVERYSTGYGSPYFAPDEVLMLLAWLNTQGLFVQSMEAVEVIEPGVNEPGRIDLSILGLDGEEDWEAHKDVERANQLAEAKLKRALECQYPVKVQIWLAHE
ncbi:hypothetical protein [Aliiroseovarius sp. F20344]|uniref:hypothetical protein n=1 Tax=Aliiroseovarius sp. F20344 TaxID=2926414 RepID=UPI001FF1BC25|nr:hypothetical protein [Aliiroseovarius sp. F20344]MCK0142564.1 hypothetical protein [Aliiroseovarius sp. F20344]